MLDHSPDMTGDQFETIAAIARRQLLGAVPEQVARLHWDPPRLAQYRSTRLTETIRFAEHSPWHADRLSGLDLEAVTPDDLTSLPTMTKADVMDAWDRIVTDPRLSLVAARQHLAGVDDGGLPFLLGEYFVFTTGAPLASRAYSSGRWRNSLAGVQAPSGSGSTLATRRRSVSRSSLPAPCAIPQHGHLFCSTGGVPEPDSLWVVSSMLPALVDAAAQACSASRHDASPRGPMPSPRGPSMQRNPYLAHVPSRTTQPPMSEWWPTRLPPRKP